MGQYHIVVNLDKRQFLHPHRLGDGLKLMEWGSGGGVTMALAALLAISNNRGGGDLRSDDPIIGTWAGDRIVVAGDYADPGQFVEPLELAPGQTGMEPALPGQSPPADIDDDPNGAPTLYRYAQDNFEDISLKMREVLQKAGERVGPAW